MSTPGASIVIFWSWQSDSHPDVNQKLIQRCLGKAARRLAKEHALIISVDRDTRGVGGTPAIADTILTKIRSADIFVWDATFISLKPRATPNPNVLFELGYAFAVLGEGRIIGVMNMAGVPQNTPLPFDLNHRRWPIKYSLHAPDGKVAGRRLRRSPPPENQDAVQEELINDLTNAIKSCLQEPKGDALRSDVDARAAQTLWGAMGSKWLREWHETQMGYPMYETRNNIDIFDSYLRLAEQPENHFRNPRLQDTHDGLLKAIRAYLRTSGDERVSDGMDRGEYVISTKRIIGYVEDYDERYERQVEALSTATEFVWSSWKSYIDELRTYYPDLTVLDGGPKYPEEPTSPTAAAE